MKQRRLSSIFVILGVKSTYIKAEQGESFLINWVLNLWGNRWESFLPTGEKQKRKYRGQFHDVLKTGSQSERMNKDCGRTRRSDGVYLISGKRFTFLFSLLSRKVVLTTLIFYELNLDCVDTIFHKMRT